MSFSDTVNFEASIFDNASIAGLIPAALKRSSLSGMPTTVFHTPGATSVQA